MKKPYHIVSREADTAAATVEQFAKANGQILLPLVELSTQARLAVDEVIDRDRAADHKNDSELKR